MTRRHLQFTDEIDPEKSIIESDDGLVDWTRREIGDGLRTIGAYNETTFELLYATEEVREQYTRDEILAVGDEFVMSHVRENEYQERLYHLGGLNYVVHGFEDGQVFRIPLEHNTGLIVTVDRTADVSLPSFIEDLKAERDVAFR